MDNEDHESPSSSPVPGPSRDYETDDLSMGGEAEPFPAQDQDEELGLAGPSYRYLGDDDRSPAPSHSGMEADYDIIGVHQEASMSLSRQFDVFSGSSSPSAPCSSSSGYIQSSFSSLPSTSRARVPGSSDPVFSAHSQPLHNELLPFSGAGTSSHTGGDWDPGHDLPISSSWSVSDSGQPGTAGHPASDWDREAAGHMRAGPSDWDSEAGGPGVLPGPSSLEQAVPGQLTLEGEDQDSRDLQWTASSSGIDRHLDYSEDNSLESEVQQSFSQYNGGIETSAFSPQPSSSGSLVSGSMMSGTVSSLVSADQSLADMLAAGPSNVPSVSRSMPGPSSGSSQQQPAFGSSNVVAKRSRSFPDSPTTPEMVKRPRIFIDDERPDSPGFNNYNHPDNATGHIDEGPDDDIIVLDGPSRSLPFENPSRSDSAPTSMSSQISREIENCLKEDGYVSRSSSIDNMPGPSHQHQPPRVSFGDVASSVSYFRSSNGPSPSNVNLVNFGNVVLQQEAGPPSPTGSEVLAPGPSQANDDIHLDIELHDSPSGSEVGAAGSSQPSSVADNNPDSPAPSESDADEGGPSVRGYMIRFGPNANNDMMEREAAPVGRSVSPVNRSRSRRNLSDSCLISSSTGPVDSNPPTPEMFGVSGDIDHEYSPSPPSRRYNYRYDDNDDEAVVDSTVDSTNIPFVLNDYEGNEVSHIDDDSDDDTENESVAGSEASSTTSARIDEHRLSLPGQDDNEGISTSGQVDVGQFRLVPNDIDLSFEERFPTHPVHVPAPAPAAQFVPVPDIQEIILEQPIVSEASQPEPVNNQNPSGTFKKPFNRKERLIDNANVDLEPVAGPSGLQRPVPFPSNRGQNQNHHSSSQSSSSSLFFSEDDYTNNLNIGLAFSGLPSSVTLTRSPANKDKSSSERKDSEPSNNSSEELLPLTKRLKSRHYEEQARSSSNDGSSSSSSNHVNEMSHEQSNNVERVSNNSDILRSSLEGNPPNNNAAQGSSSGAGPSNAAFRNTSSESNDQENLGGVQQNFSVTIETSNIYLSTAKPKYLATKSAGELKEYLPLDQSSSEVGLSEDTVASLDSFLNPPPPSESSTNFDSSSFLTLNKRTVHEEQEPSIPEQITISICDQPVQSRAVASLPSNYLSLRTIDASNSAVVAVRTIPVSCRFGPMEGRLVDPGQDISTSVSLALIVGDQRLDVTSEEESNWMRFIRTATTSEDQNLTLSEISGQLYFTSTREIAPDEELRVWYSEQYAHQHSLPVNPVQHNQSIVAAAPVRKRPIISPTVGENIAEKSKKDSDGPNFTCDICQRKFERQASLLRHLALHKGDKNFTCDLCGRKFSHTFNLERHKKKVHNTDTPGQHVCCTVCAVWFPSNMVLKVHMFSHHPNKEEQNWTVEDAMAQSGKNPEEQSHEEMKFQCPSEGCECQYDTWLQLVEHAMDHGTPFHPGSETTQKQGSVHKCELCYKTFATDARLQKHMAVHAGDENKPLECKDCCKRFLTNSALAGHIKTHAHPDTLYDCPICGQEFEQVSSLKDHVYTHKENGTFTCPYCEKTFNEYPQIRKHIRAFHAEKRFPCTMCDKSFTGRDKLKVHMVRHSETKDFSCDDCGKQFKRKDKLREHVKRMHSGNNTARKEPVIEEDSNSSSKFIPKVSPTELHRFIYKCQTCMLGFKRRGMLVNHLAKRHPTVTPSSVPELNLPILKTTKDFYCQYCDKVYKSSSKRKSHILKNHPGAPLPAGAREVAPNNIEASTFSQTVGSVTSQPHKCDLCHKQYASKAKLLQHLRKEHKDQAGPSTSTKGERPKEVLYLDPTSPINQDHMMVDVDCPEGIDNTINLAHDELFNEYILTADQQDVHNNRESSNSTQTLNMSELESHASDKKTKEVGVTSGSDQQEPSSIIVGDQEFILLQPGPSSEDPINFQDAGSSSDPSLAFHGSLYNSDNNSQ